MPKMFGLLQIVMVFFSGGHPKVGGTSHAPQIAPHFFLAVI